MSIELKIPEVGESVQEVQIGRWLKQQGDEVKQDDELVELETDKASLDLPAPATGVLAKILKREGDTVSVGEVIAHIEQGGEPESGSKRSPEKQRKKKSDKRATGKRGKKKKIASATKQRAEGAAPDSEVSAEEEIPSNSQERETPRGEEAETDLAQGVPATPAARRALRLYGLTAEEVEPAGDRLRGEDIERHVRETSEQERRRPSGEGGEADGRASEVAEPALEELVPMSLIRRRIGQRLVAAQQQAALLTTFNEIDMSSVIQLRREYRQRFQQEYGIDLGYMPFFVKATIDALRHFPELNAEIRQDKIAYRDFYHVGIAIGGGKGLVVPVLRFAERLSFAEIESAIGDFARRAESKQLEPSDLEGGTFTITNGGVYGSLLSTPIVNPPQSGVLGMHAIEDRPVARQGEVVVRPMMYVALTYDHRIVDGREAVLFLRRVKEAIEEPARMLIEV